MHYDGDPNPLIDTLHVPSYPKSLKCRLQNSRMKCKLQKSRNEFGEFWEIQIPLIDTLHVQPAVWIASTGNELEITTFSIELENTESTDGHCCQSVVAVARLNVCSNVAVWPKMYGVEARNANFWGRNCSSSEVQSKCKYLSFSWLVHFLQTNLSTLFVFIPCQILDKNLLYRPSWCTVTRSEFSPHFANSHHYHITSFKNLIL